MASSAATSFETEKTSCTSPQCRDRAGVPVPARAPRPGRDNAQPRCREYAITLGLALQVTNIIRDVARDLRADRIYLPGEDLARFDYTEEDLRNGVTDTRFIQLMNFEAGRAEEFFAESTTLLPREDHRSMLPAEIMRSIYQALLRRMKLDNFRMFEKDYRLSKTEKARRAAAQLLKIF